MYRKLPLDESFNSKGFLLAIVLFVSLMWVLLLMFLFLSLTHILYGITLVTFLMCAWILLLLPSSFPASSQIFSLWHYSICESLYFIWYARNRAIHADVLIFVVHSFQLAVLYEKQIGLRLGQCIIMFLIFSFCVGFY